MLEPGTSVLAAVSGGADSVALLYCLAALADELKLSIQVAHLNHDLRGEESRADQDFVRRLSRGLGLPFHTETAQLAGPGNLEARARRERYGYLRRVAGDCRAARIALGHTLDDQAETVLLRLLRGSGLRGLSAIRPVMEGGIVRPLIESSRKDVRDYLQSRELEWREDSSNMDLSFRRNRVRHELLPYLETHFNRRIRSTLANEAALARSASDFMHEAAARELHRIQRHGGTGTTVAAAELADLHPGLREGVIRSLHAASGGVEGSLTASHVVRVLELCEAGKSGRSVPLPGGVVVIREFDELLFLDRDRPPPSSYSLSLAVPGECPVPSASLRFTAELLDSRPTTIESVDEAVLDAECVPFGLEIRTRLPGDRYGALGGCRLNRLLMEHRVPLSKRGTLPLVASGRAVVWVPGLPPPRALLPGNKTVRWLRLRVLRDTS